MAQLCVKVMISGSRAQRMVNLQYILIACMRMKYQLMMESSAGVWTRKYLKEGNFSYRCVGNNAVGAPEKIVYIAIKGGKFSLTFTERSVARIFQQGKVSHRVKLRLPS